MFKLFIIASLAFTSVIAAGEFEILNSPSSIEFKGNDRLDESLLKEVYSAALGYSVEQSSSWPGMFITDPFNLPNAIVSVNIDGIQSLGVNSYSKSSYISNKFPLHTNDDFQNTYNTLKQRIGERNPTAKLNLIYIDLSQGLAALHEHEIFFDVKNVKVKKPFQGHLKVNVEEDHEFLEQVALLEAISNKISELSVSSKQAPDMYFFDLPGLHAVSDLHGENSTATKEAKQILNQAIQHLNEAFKDAYKGKVLSTVITSDASHTRRTRSLLQKEEPLLPQDLNLAKDYNPEYPVIFNIILWFGVIMVFSLLAICLAIANMDPGRDSIIYRMTSNRMKKDN